MFICSNFIAGWDEYVTGWFEHPFCPQFLGFRKLFYSHVGHQIRAFLKIVI